MKMTGSFFFRLRRADAIPYWQQELQNFENHTQKVNLSKSKWQKIKSFNFKYFKLQLNWSKPHQLVKQNTFYKYLKYCFTNFNFFLKKKTQTSKQTNIAINTPKRR